MEDIQQNILDTYISHPKHFTQMLKRDEKITEYVNTVAESSGAETFLEKLYYAVYQEPIFCKNGNKKKLKSFKGYGFCGRANICECAKNSVSEKVSLAKNNYTDEKSAAINEKRKLTTLLLHGVSNNGQTKKSVAAHEELYKNKDKVNVISEQIKNTKLHKHGDATFNNRTKAAETCLIKYGVTNTYLITEDNSNPLLGQLRDKEELAKLFPKLPVSEIATQLSVAETTVYRYLNLHGFREPYKSTFEKEIVDYLQTIGITNILTNKRSIIGKELDIFLPDYNLAIEYNGVYWHHDKIPYITKTYHRDKFLNCEKNEIELFTIFSDSWDNKKDVWKNKIRAKLGLSETTVYARKTKVVDLKASGTREILNKHHVQGYCAAQYCHGLEYNGEIVAVMTFSKKRAGIGKDRGNGSFELVRYVTSANVVGGASKLLKHFIKTNDPATIFSYSDNQYSVGKLYSTLGFELEKDNNAGYKYYDPTNKKMYHRYKFAKHKLIEAGFNPTSTEKEIMDGTNYLRIWDCGSRTWVLTLK